MIETKRIFSFFAVFCFAVVSSRHQEDCYNFERLIHEKIGNVTISAIFDGNAGENCSRALDFGLEEMAAAVWTVTALERHNYLPGVQLGISIFDACSNEKSTNEALAEAIIHESCYRRNVTNLGVLASPEVHSRLAPFSRKLNKTVTKLEHMLDLDDLLSVVTELLSNLHWNTVNRVVADGKDVLDKFSRRMSEEGICIYEEVLSIDAQSVNNRELHPAERIGFEDVPLMVLLCTSENIVRIFRELSEEMRALPARWLVVPVDFALSISPGDWPERVFTILPLIEKRDRLEQFLSDEEMQKDHMNHREATRSPVFVETALGILQLLMPLKSVHERYCVREKPCEEFIRYVEGLRNAEIRKPETVLVTPEVILTALNALKIDATDNELFLYITSLVRKEKTEDAAIFQVFDVKRPKTMKPVLLILNERLFDEDASDSKTRKFPEFPDKHPCAAGDNLTKACGACRNFYSTTVVDEPEPEVTWSLSWRFRTWVAINASVASIGVICTLTVTAFIIFRLCKGDILEGSPVFSFLILLSIIITYASTLPFSLDDSDSIIPQMRIIVPGTSYSLLFSVILSRSLMLAFSERDSGFMNHVSGCLQGVLCFFMFCVQIAITAEFWIYNSYVLDEPERLNMYTGCGFMILLGYSSFLLLLLALVSPAIIKSKRNYKEGMFFSVGTLLIIAVWSIWIALFHVLPVEEKDAAVAFGLTGTATAVLLSVFIPRTYLMATAIVRDKITNTLPSLAYINSSNISDINYRSNQALYDSVTVKCRSPKLGYSNPKIYTNSNSAPVSPSYSPDDGILHRRKTFVDVPRGATPENSYESYESPDFQGKITKF